MTGFAFQVILLATVLDLGHCPLLSPLFWQEADDVGMHQTSFTAEMEKIDSAASGANQGPAKVRAVDNATELAEIERQRLALQASTEQFALQVAAQQEAMKVAMSSFGNADSPVVAMAAMQKQMMESFTTSMDSQH